MSRPVDTRALTDLERQLLRGRIGRRQFILRAVALGLSASGVAAALAACGGASPTATSAPAATSAPTTAPAATKPAATTAPSGGGAATATTAPAAATKPAGSPAAQGGGPTKRGGGGTLKMLQWQAPTILNPHLSSGTKDDLVCAIVYEPLMDVDNDGKFVPKLADHIPTKESGEVAADGKSATWKLKAGLKWSDGQPVTADDIVFNWEYCTDEKTAATDVALYDTVAKVEKIDDQTVKFSFTDPYPAWYRPAQASIIPKHVFEKDKGEAARNSQNNLNPVGTGPYKVTSFKPGDMVVYAINENYRDANKPSFDQVQVKGGGDAVSAARAVLQTGDFDYAWNLQIADNIIKQLESAGKGVAEFQPGGGIERIFLNFTDPNKEDPATGERSSLKFPHPFFTDKNVREAFAHASNKEEVVKGVYGRGGAVGLNFLEDPPQYNSTNPKNEEVTKYDLAKANALLDAAGWKKNGQYREKDGKQMSVVYSTTVNQVRQQTQQIIKAGWESVGIKTELKSVDSGVFFSSDAGNPDTSGHMYVDCQMYTTSAGIDPQAHMKRWTSEAADLSQKAHQWSGGNNGRYKNPDYDKLWKAATTELDDKKRADLFKQMNDILVQDIVMIAIVSRKSVYARTKSLQNVNYTEWATDYWNIANWVKA
ncbi:MAG TPA: peptide ABC transporter substrate-binding protein [Thermomicrobiales bacterium]|nr:peptide ABC transporter substrate-binding protein [Thermomicrobiales bacterium]